ncbi:MAG: YbaB/EbfC family nucleoid-associated protein [Candidatus Cryosericum sp.]
MYNVNAIMKQAQKMQEDAARAEQELLDRRISATSGGGAVTAIVNGKKDLIGLSIRADLDCSDTEMTADLVTAAVREAQVEADRQADEVMKKVTAGMPHIPGLG